MMIIHLVAAARPNFMKIAPLYHALENYAWAKTLIVHTGQHYDINMSDAFFQDLRLPEAHIHLGVGSGSHAEQTGNVLIKYERVLAETRPDLVIVVGDVNSTIAASLAAVKLGILVGHLEAGLRSFDRSMPEEINRIMTDSIADILWTPSPDGDKNLLNEGIPQYKICRVGNIMIDSLEMLRGKIEQQKASDQYGLPHEGYGVVTIHRPSNVDSMQVLSKLCGIIERVAQKIPLIFPVHPRTKKNIEKAELWEKLNRIPNLIIESPLNYLKFMSLVFDCRFVLTDSGGIQEETTYLGIPCLTMRPNTERPITVELGTNKLCSMEKVELMVERTLGYSKEMNIRIDLWDGHTADRVVQSIDGLFH